MLSPACLGWPQTLILQIPFGQASQLGLVKCQKVSHGLGARRYPHCCYYQAGTKQCRGAAMDPFPSESMLDPLHAPAQLQGLGASSHLLQGHIVGFSVPPPELHL